MFLSYLRLLVFYFLFFNARSAPTNETSSSTLFEIIQNDPRAIKLKNRLFVKIECSKEVEIAESFCLAFYSIAINFNQAQLNFTNSSIEKDDDFCSKLNSVLPEASSMDESTLLSIKKNYRHPIVWLKDIFKKNPEKCEEECITTTINLDDSMDVKAKPMCFFIFNQYKFLQQYQHPAKLNSEPIQNSTIDKNAIKVEEKLVTLPAATHNISNDVPKVAIPNPADEITPINTTPVKNNITLPQPQQEPLESSEVKPKEEKNETPPIAAANKTVEVTKSTKPDTTINTDDDQQNLNDNDVFDAEVQTEFPDKTEDIDGNDTGIDPEEDDEDEYHPDIVRDNNRNVQNKFNNHLQLTEVEAPETDPRVRVESVVFEEDPDSNFFTYLCAVMFASIVLYILYHNRQKILALVLEGRRGSRRQRERSRGGSKAAYSKLDCNLEEAITSKKSLSGKTMDIIY